MACKANFGFPGRKEFTRKSDVMNRVTPADSGCRIAVLFGQFKGGALKAELFPDVGNVGLPIEDKKKIVSSRSERKWCVLWGLCPKIQCEWPWEATSLTVGHGL